MGLFNRNVLGIIFGNVGGGVTEPKIVGIISVIFLFAMENLSGLQTYLNLHPPLRVGPLLGCLLRGGANLCRLVPVQI